MNGLHEILLLSIQVLFLGFLRISTIPWFDRGFFMYTYVHLRATHTFIYFTLTFVTPLAFRRIMTLGHFIVVFCKHIRKTPFGRLFIERFSAGYLLVVLYWGSVTYSGLSFFSNICYIAFLVLIHVFNPNVVLYTAPRFLLKNYLFDLTILVFVEILRLSHGVFAASRWCRLRSSVIFLALYLRIIDLVAHGSWRINIEVFPIHRCVQKWNTAQGV